MLTDRIYHASTQRFFILRRQDFIFAGPWIVL